ncbi:MAG: hypothetical protein A2Y62_05885 [Candidatus Fischerbacteria bacterium RBG_13_37_8]|uniref:Sulfatase N-terminal domain-containing protein n=1 Tax=Candidatus Fischerbacteria bacterium RBG_13_37_8 TaxID=1817863 RepID=A0A1F5V6G8_9BACT|nr:MAG: hypothetical protein A2Y62_05885 [Candidatus Fischerbacteria bacterium RBG_13_37_8]
MFINKRGDIVLKKIIIIILLLLILSGGLLAWKYFYHKHKVIVIGLDGATWKFLNPLMKEHKLPNFEKIMKNAAYGELKTTKPTKSAVLWTSIATGKKMEKHGIVDWTYVSEDAKAKIQRVQLITGKHRTAATIWEILGKKNYTVGVVNWWVTYPATPVNGFLISDRLRTAIIKPSIANEKNLVYPPELINELKPYLLKPANTIPIMMKYGFETYSQEKVEQFFSPSKFFRNMFSQIHLYVGHDQMTANWSLHMLRKKQPDFFGVVMRITDVYAHLGWKFIDKQYLEDTVPQIKLDSIRSKDEAVRHKAFKLIHELDQKYAEVMLPAYKFADDFLGEVMSIADKNTTIIIISDHGFMWHGGGYDHNPMIGHSYPDEPPRGIIIMYGKDVIPGKIENANIYNITPTILYAFNEPLARDMDGKAIKEAFSDPIFQKRGDKRIASYGVGPVSSKAVPTDAAEKEMMEDLKSLGYVQ